MKKNRFVLLFIISFLLFSLINTICYTAIHFIPSIGYRDSSKLIEIYIFPLLFSSSIILFNLNCFERAKSKWFIWLPFLILIIKLFIVLCIGYDIYVADLLVSSSSAFSELFNLFLHLLDANNIQNDITEILYQALIIGNGKP